MKNKKIISYLVATGIGLLVFVCDIVSKYVIEMSLTQEGDTAPFLPGFINFKLVHNDGAAFGVFGGNSALLIVATLIIIAMIIGFYIYRARKLDFPISITLSIGIGLIAGGCFGNLYDRIVFGYVRDFLNFQFMNFPSFNIADASLCVGMAILVIYFIFIFSREEKKRGKQ